MDLCVFAIFQFSMDLCAFSYVMIRIKLRTYVISLLHGTNFAYDKGIFYFLFYAGTVPARYPYSDSECCGTVPVLGLVPHSTVPEVVPSPPTYVCTDIIIKSLFTLLKVNYFQNKSVRVKHTLTYFFL